MRILTATILSLPLVGAYAIFAIGIVLIYRASSVLNLAHGAMAMVPAYLTYSLVKAHIPMPIAFLLALAAGAGLGLAIERLFVRRLRGQSETAQTVGTVAALGLLVALAAKVWGTTPREAVRIFPKGFLSIGNSGIQVGELGLFFVMAVVAAGLFLLLQRTDLGLMMRGTAESRLAATLHGVNPDRITEFTWALGGGLGALAGVLLAAVTNLNPYVLTLQALPGFIAALLGGLGSLPGAVVGAAIVGVTQSLVPVIPALERVQGGPQLLLALLAMGVMALRGKSIVGVSDVRGDIGQVSGAAAQPDEEERDHPLRPYATTIGIGLAVTFPLFAPFSVLGAANLGATYSLIAISVVILTGWVGQISLGHAALVGVSAYVTGWVAGGLGLPFPLSMLPAAAAAALAAAALGMVALRVRGLYLAVATLVFSWMASEFLFRQHWFTKYEQIPDRLIGQGTFPSFDFTDRRVFFFIAWAFVLVAAYGAINLRDSKIGRAFFAVRGSEMAAASLGIDVMRTKLIAFAVSGAVAGAAGNLVLSGARVINADQFTFNVSLFFLAIAVIGGLSSVGGAIASGLLFAGLTEVFFRVRFLGGLLEIVSALLLAFVLLAYPGGLTALPRDLRRLLARQMASLSFVARAGSRGREAMGSTERGAGRFVAVGAERLKAVLERVGPGPRRLARRLDGLSRGIPRRGPGASRRLTGLIRGGSAESNRPVAAIDFRALLSTDDLADFQPEPGHNNGHDPAATVPDLKAFPAEQVVAPSTNGDQGGRERVARLKARLSAHRPQGDRELRRPLIEAQGVTVRFGGLTAVNNASLAVREGEIVGLIGPNGAGKTTLFNAIAGFNRPTAGAIRLFDVDATSLPVHERARLGVARTFQLIQLFGSLTVFDNLLVATHVHNPTGLFSNVMAGETAIEHEGEARERVSQVLDLLDLSDISRRRAADLPFGVLRMVEVARALVTGFPLMMLDEPASGLDNTETDRLTDMLRFVRGLGVTQLLIEHDVRMVTSVSDYMYVLDQGRIIAQGVPEEIQRNPAVIAAYLGEPATEAVG